jgi:hypothetical protein
MVIAGEWLTCEDGITRPVILAKVLGGGGQYHADNFLVDSGADRTVLSAELLSKLEALTNRPKPDFSLHGVGGESNSVPIKSVLEFERQDGKPARVRGEFAAFTDPEATDFSILGRDVLDNFDVILSRTRGEVLFLAGNHKYRIDQTV